MTALLLLIACGPARVEPVEEIETSETAFVIPLEDAPTSDQERVLSADYWREHQVARKRVVVPVRKRKIGRGWWAYEWLPTMDVIRVDRAPVNRHWLDESESGGESFHLESKDSIGFFVGVDITAEIHEEDAASYLYHNGPKPLSVVIDTAVRSYILSDLSTSFGSLDLTDGVNKKSQISKDAFARTRDHFAPMGITITNMGLTGGMTYEDPEIQEAMNRGFLADQRVQIAANELDAIKKEGESAVAAANAEADAASALISAASSLRFQQELEIEMMTAEAEIIRAEAAKIMAEKWDGGLPSELMPADSPWVKVLGM